METDTPWRFTRFERETRYYELRLQQDLFGWVVVKSWGRKESWLGQMRSVPCDGYPEALQKWRAGLRARQRRGYVEYHESPWGTQLTSTVGSLSAPRA